jgi:hypothetical protein
MKRRFEQIQHRRGLTLVTKLTTSVLVLAALLVVPCSFVSAAPTPTALLKAALRDAIAGRWVHEVGLSSEGGTSSKYIDDIGTNEGQQEIALSNGVHAQVIAFDQEKRMYVRANALGIATFFGISKTQPGQYANRWLIVTPENKNYVIVASDTTLKSDFESQLAPYGTVSAGGDVTLAGIQAQSLRWTIPKSKNFPTTHVTLYVTVADKPLPIELSEKSTSGDYVVRWTKWGTAVSLVAPKGAEPMPISSTGQAA